MITEHNAMLANRAKDVVNEYLDSRLPLANLRERFLEIHQLQLADDDRINALSPTRVGIELHDQLRNNQISRDEHNRLWLAWRGWTEKDDAVHAVIDNMFTAIEFYSAPTNDGGPSRQEDTLRIALRSLLDELLAAQA